MDSTRRLCTPGFDDWDYGWAGIITDYLILVTCVVLASITLSRSRGPRLWWSITSQLLVFLVLNGIAYGGGGSAHHLLNTYHSDGGVMGKAWGAKNSGWMYPWLVAMIFSSLTGAFALSTICAFSSYPSWSGIPGYVIGGSVAVMEAYIFIATDTGVEVTGTANGLWGMGSAAIGTAVLAVGLCQRGPSGGLAMALGGLTSLFLGFLVVFSVPGSCRKVGKEHEGCPFPEIFNQNAVFHVLSIISLILVTVGTLQKAEADCIKLPQ
ncbi:unnamed protein product [Polarella glacialis]|uniref:Uncharacterized protein n=1 Tax=Polarella glacialis TaxID=89957 RepID=A0A813LJJ4_POLGL|nr:unnamed protein product [Polarella glacialis]CAE8646361.1 unnamed protein product [Polarella glacialis]CAE8728896.1 unnamed protein product [Polarella glacialis]